MADTETAIQMVWDAAWALHDGQPDWQPSKRLKDAIDALIDAVRAENDAETQDLIERAERYMVELQERRS
jgi:hypothetical protein